MTDLQRDTAHHVEQHHVQCEKPKTSPTKTDMVQIDICERARQTQTGMRQEGLQNLNGPAMNIIWP